MTVRHQYQNRESGYIALLSTIIIGAVLLVMTVEAGRLGFYTRFIVLGSESKELSRVLALGCAEQAAALVVTNPVWLGSATTTDSVVGSCYIFPIQKNFPNVGEMTIRVQSVVRNSVTNVVKVYDMHEVRLVNAPVPLPLFVPGVQPNVFPEVIGWTEIPILP